MATTIRPSEISGPLTKITPIAGISIEAAAQSLTALLDAEASERVNQIRTYRDYYNGRQIPEAGSDGEELPYVNLCYGVIEKQVAWLVGEKPELKAREDIQPIIEELYKEIEENSGDGTIYSDAVREGSITGDAFLHVAYDVDANYGKGGFVIRLTPSDRTFPEYRNVGNSVKLSKILHCWDQINDNGVVETIFELWDKDYVSVSPPNLPLSLSGFPNEEEIPYEVIDGPDGKMYRRYKNPYNEIPFVHIQNLRLTDSVFGRSDLHDLWILNKEMNEQLLSYKENVEYHGNPITLLFGLSADSIEKGADKVWGNLPTESDVKNLEVTQTHEAILKYLDLIREFTGLGNIPYNLLGNTTDPSTLKDTSGVAMKLSFLPVTEVIERKHLTYGKGFREVYEMALRFTAMLNGLDLDNLDGLDERTLAKITEDPRLTEPQKEKLIMLRTAPWWKTEIIWKDHLPKSRQAELADIVLELQNKLESIPGALRRLGVKDVESKMDEIVETQELIGSMTALATPIPVEEAGIDGNVSDDVGGAGRTARPESTSQVEERTGQSSARTAEQRATGTGTSD